MCIKYCRIEDAGFKEYMNAQMRALRLKGSKRHLG